MVDDDDAEDGEEDGPKDAEDVKVSDGRDVAIAGLVPFSIVAVEVALMSVTLLSPLLPFRFPRRSSAQTQSIPILVHRVQHLPPCPKACPPERGALFPLEAAIIWSFDFLHPPVALWDEELWAGWSGGNGTQRTFRFRQATQACDARTALGRMKARGMRAGSVSKEVLSVVFLVVEAEADVSAADFFEFVGGAPSVNGWLTEV